MLKSQRTDRGGVLAREAAFHDAVVAGRDPATAEPQPPDPWESAILEAVAPLAGRNVLDYGCGDGALCIHLADAGAASVTGIDISPASIGFARERTSRFRPGAPIEFLTASAEATGLPDASFDVVAGRFVLHHLDFPAAVDEVFRLLRPGGRGVFIETSGLNRPLMIARSQIVHRGRFGAVRVSTEDEHPLTRRDLRLLRARFRHVRVDFPIFWMFRPFASQVLVPRYPRFGHRVSMLDAVLQQRVGVLRSVSYHMRISVSK